MTKVTKEERERQKAGHQSQQVLLRVAATSDSAAAFSKLQDQNTHEKKEIIFYLIKLNN